MKDVANIIVLVSGTVDPGNLDSDKLKRSASYRAPNVAWWLNDPNWYWQENSEFNRVLNSLREQYTNLHLFTAHGWSGDNAATNRRIVGAYLANRLCGAGGEKSYYEGLLDQEVSFHFIGHSHGGNVINELTRRASELLPRGNPLKTRAKGVWPSQWKIRSITYLSTPFFKRLHQVNTGVFHEDCRIINVYNEYDLTQRVVADFSLSPMHELLKQSGGAALQKQISNIHFDASVLNAVTSVAMSWKNTSTKEFDPTLVMKPSQGRKLYDACLALLGKLQGTFKAMNDVVCNLNQGITFPVPIKVDGKMTTRRQVMSNELAHQVQGELQKLQASLLLMQKAFKERRAQDRYPISGFLADLHVARFLQSLINFLWVDPKQLKGPLWDLVYKLLLEQLEEFDDTTNTPAAQLAKTAFANRIDQVNVTPKDPYSQFGRAPTYKRFIEYLEKAEARYDKGKDRLDLMDLLFTLLAQTETLRAKVEELQGTVETTRKIMDGLMAYAMYKGMLSTPLMIIWELMTVLGSYVEIFKARNFGQMETTVFPTLGNFGPFNPAPKASSTPTGPYLAAPQPTLHVPVTYGSLDYFMRVSHSISRQEVYDPVLKVLKQQINSQTRTPAGMKKAK